MTDQPTTWTPEMEDALKRVIKDVDTYGLTSSAQRLRDMVSAALESAAAEIERQKARADGLAAEVQRMNDDTLHQVRLSEPYVPGNLRCQPWWVIVKTLAEGEKKEWARADAAEKDALDFSEAVNVWLRRFVPDLSGSNQSLMVFVERMVERLRAELAAKQPAEAEAAQQGPSDEEIREQFCRVDWARAMTAETAAMVHLVKLVEMVARRAGVKL